MPSLTGHRLGLTGHPTRLRRLIWMTSLTERLFRLLPQLGRLTWLKRLFRLTGLILLSLILLSLIRLTRLVRTRWMPSLTGCLPGHLFGLPWLSRLTRPVSLSRLLRLPCRQGRTGCRARCHSRNRRVNSLLSSQPRLRGSCLRRSRLLTRCGTQLTGAWHRRSRPCTRRRGWCCCWRWHPTRSCSPRTLRSRTTSRSPWLVRSGTGRSGRWRTGRAARNGRVRPCLGQLRRTCRVRCHCGNHTRCRRGHRSPRSRQLTNRGVRRTISHRNRRLFRHHWSRAMHEWALHSSDLWSRSTHCLGFTNDRNHAGQRTVLVNSTHSLGSVGDLQSRTGRTGTGQHLSRPRGTGSQAWKINRLHRHGARSWLALAHIPPLDKVITDSSGEAASLTATAVKAALGTT